MAKTPGRAKSVAPTRKDPERKYTRYGPRVRDEICRRLAEGETWFAMCSRDGMPSHSALYQWRRKHPEFAEAVAVAREVAAERRADEALTVAQATTPATVSADRLKVSALMTRAALDAPHQWGGKAAPAAAQAEPQRVEIVFRVRRFEKVVGEDGRAVLREIFPEGEA